MTAADRLARCFAQIMTMEGGAKYTNDPHDPGGPTRWGVTLKTLTDWRGHPCFAADVEDLTEAEAQAIFAARYWHAIAGDSLPAGLDLQLADAAYNQGPGRAARFLQAAVGVAEDGAIGPATLGALSKVSVAQVIERVRLERMNAYYRAPGWATYAHGWTNRVTSITALAHQWAAEPLAA